MAGVQCNECARYTYMKVEISNVQANNAYFQYYKLIHFRFSPK